ncbi:uncharacterized protein YutE (UPF0331/DUF86 family) [Desulfitispora alkaliphila]|uniref:type VII toxin-antitoxin system HepT family RNase toxin n=1 Tax=Desulfitispora alkaliphila TaxID=622674 RepID=UPI003D1A1EB8
MTKLEVEIIKEKLLRLQLYYKELKELEHITYQDYCNNSLYKRSVERLIQLIVEVSTDINNMILKGLRKGPTVDYYSSFIELAEADVFSMEFALKIAPSTGLRNVIVHEYQKIDDEIVYNSIKETLTQYYIYIEEVHRFINA